MPTGDWSGHVEGAGIWSEAAVGEPVNSLVLHSGVTGQTPFPQKELNDL